MADEATTEANYTDILELDLSTVEPSLAGPARPQDRVTLPGVKKSVRRRARHVSLRARRPR